MKNIIKSLVLVVAVAAIAGVATYSYFSDTATSTQNTFSSGVLSINDGKLVTTAVSLPNMAPGDVTEPYTVVIENNGTMNLAWLGNWEFSGNSTLMNALYIADAKMEFLVPNESKTWLNDTTEGYETGQVDHFITNGVGSGPYPSCLKTVASTGSFGLLTFNAWNNNSCMAPGSVYEHAGALRPGYKYRLTVKFGMAAAAGNTYQNLGPVTAQLQVKATQINSAALQELGVPAATANEWTATPTSWMNNQIADQTEE